MAACDFWSGLVNMPEFAEAIDAIEGVSMHAEDELELVISCYNQLKAALPSVLPSLLLCCNFTSTDQMDDISAKEEDLTAHIQSKNEVEDEEEDYE